MNGGSCRQKQQPREEEIPRGYAFHSEKRNKVYGNIPGESTDTADQQKPKLRIQKCDVWVKGINGMEERSNGNYRSRIRFVKHINRVTWDL